MAEKRNAPTMKDVAREAGVSLGTVSKVVNGLPVGREYRKRVAAAIQKLGYRVNAYAKGLKTNRSGVVAFLAPDTCNPFFGTVAYYVHRALWERGYRMLLCATDADPGQEQEMVSLVQQNRVDGIICYSFYEALQIPEDIPVVTIDRQVSPAVPCVTSDNFAGGRFAAQKLAENGCNQLLYLGVEPRLYHEPSKRGDGFRSYCIANHLAYEEKRLHDGEDFAGLTEFLAQRIHAGKADFDGIFCVNDPLAGRVIRYLRDAGIDIPGQVQVIGYDGVADIATGQYACSTMAQPLEQMAGTAVEILLRSGQAAASSLVCLPVNYIRGGTTRD